MGGCSRARFNCQKKSEEKGRDGVPELIDRVPGDPGRMRIVPEGGTAFYAKVELADNPVKAGNKVSRRNVIDTLLPESEDGGVGTVVLSVLGNPDERWLLCDGADMTESSYELLKGHLDERPIQAASLDIRELKGADGTVIDMDVIAVRYVNGFYVAVGTNGDSSSSIMGCIAYSRDMKIWTKVDVAESTGYNGEVQDIVYGGGYYVAGAIAYTKRDSDYRVTDVYYATDLGGPWTKVRLHDTSYLAKIKVRYLNGRFVVLNWKIPAGNTAYYTGVTRSYTATSDDIASWTAASWGNTSCSCMDVLYDAENGRYELWGCWNTYTDDDNDNYYDGRMHFGIYVASDTETVPVALAEWQSTDCLNAKAAISFNPENKIVGVVKNGDAGMWIALCNGYLLYYDRAGGAISEEIAGTISTSTSPSYKEEWLIDDGNVMVYHCKGTSGSAVAVERYRRIGASEWTEREAAVVGVADSEFCYGLDARDADGRLLLPSTDGGVLVLADYMRKYLPDMAVPDANGLVKAYIKAK